MFGHISKKIGTLLALAGLVLLGFFFYSFSDEGEGSSQISTLPVSPLDAKLGRELLSALAELKSTKLDKSIFDDPVFESLKDFGVEIASEPVGRRNPFALFEVESGTKESGAGKLKIPQGKAGKPVSTPKTPETGGFDIN